MALNTSNEKVPMHMQIVIALVLGVGWCLIWRGLFVDRVLGQIFVAFLKMVVVPLIFCSIVVAIASIGGGKLGQARQ